MPKAKATSVRAATLSPVVWRRRTPAPTAKAGVCRSARPTLLWIDDFQPGLAMYKAMFEKLGFKVLTAASGRAGLELAALRHVDIVVTDYEMPEMDGEAVATAVKAMNPNTPVVLYSGSTMLSVGAKRAADAFCDKAGPRAELVATIQNLLHKKRSERLQPPPPTRASDHGRWMIA